MADTFCDMEKNAYDHRRRDEIEAGLARSRRAYSNEAFLYWLGQTFGVTVEFAPDTTAEQEEVVMDALKEKFGASFRIAVNSRT